MASASLVTHRMNRVFHVTICMSCVICHESVILDVSWQCTRCVEGMLCRTCWQTYQSAGYNTCPVCRQPINPSSLNDRDIPWQTTCRSFVISCHLIWTTLYCIVMVLCATFVWNAHWFVPLCTFILYSFSSLLDRYTARRFSIQYLFVLLAVHAILFLACFVIGFMHAMALTALIWSALITLSSLCFFIVYMCRQDNSSERLTQQESTFNSV